MQGNMHVWRNLSRRGFLFALGISPLMADGFWDKRPFPDWSEDEIERMLTDSPWAQSLATRFRLEDPRNQRQFDFTRFPEPPRTLPARGFSDIGLPPGIGLPTGGQGIPGIGWPGSGRGRSGSPAQYPGGSSGGGRGGSVLTEAYLTVRWSSALPIKQALVLDELGTSGLDSPEAKEILNREEQDYIVEFFGLPAIAVHMEREEMEQELTEKSELISKAGRRIRCESARVPAHGEYRSITLRFPRDNPFTLDDKQVEVAAAAGPFDFNQKFKLAPMVYNGRLEL